MSLTGYLPSRLRTRYRFVSTIVQDKLTENMPFLHKLFYGKPSLFFIEPTNACNLACVTCYRGKRKVGYMDFDLFTKIVDEAATIGAECLFLHGIGEPLLHPRFLSMLKYAKEHSNRFDMVGFCTNGTLLTEEVTDSIVELGVDRVLISLDGIGAVNERIRSGSVYNTIEKNINYLLLSRGKRLKPQVSLNVTISTQTDEELRDIYTVWHDHVDNVIFNPAVNDQFKILDLDRLKKWNPSFELGKFCIYPFRYMIILWNGEVQFCCHDFNGRGVVGNIANSNLLSVWNGEALRGVRHGIMSGKVRGTLLCNGCEKYSFHK